MELVELGKEEEEQFEKIRILHKHCIEILEQRYKKLIWYTLNEGAEEESLKIVVFKKSNGFAGLIIQLKVRGQETSKAESKRLKEFNKAGYKVFACYTSNSFQQGLQFYLTATIKPKVKYSKQTLQNAKDHYKKMKNK